MQGEHEEMPVSADEERQFLQQEDAEGVSISTVPRDDDDPGVAAYRAETARLRALSLFAKEMLAGYVAAVMDPRPRFQDIEHLLHLITNPDWRRDPEHAEKSIRAMLEMRQYRANTYYIEHLGRALQTVAKYQLALQSIPVHDPRRYFPKRKPRVEEETTEPQPPAPAANA